MKKIIFGLTLLVSMPSFGDSLKGDSYTVTESFGGHAGVVRMLRVKGETEEYIIMIDLYYSNRRWFLVTDSGEVPYFTREGAIKLRDGILDFEIEVKCEERKREMWRRGRRGCFVGDEVLEPHMIPSHRALFHL